MLFKTRISRVQGFPIAGDFTLDEGSYSNTTYKYGYAKCNYYHHEYGGYYKSYYANRGYESQGSLRFSRHKKKKKTPSLAKASKGRNELPDANAV